MPRLSRSHGDDLDRVCYRVCQQGVAGGRGYEARVPDFTQRGVNLRLAKLADIGPTCLKLHFSQLVQL